MSQLVKVISKVSMKQIPENALLDGVIKALNGREMFTDTDTDLNEKIYSGDVFEAILSENSQYPDSSIAIKDKKTLMQLEELAKLIDTEYVQLTNV